MSQTNLPTPQGKELAAAHRRADNQAALAATVPPAEAWREAFPNEFYGDVNGKHGVGYIRPGMTPAERERNIDKKNALLAAWQMKSCEISEEMSAAVDTVTVRDMHGVVSEVPVHLEGTAAGKGGRPVRKWGRRRTRYRFDALGNRYHCVNGCWTLDEE